MPELRGYRATISKPPPQGKTEVYISAEEGYPAQVKTEVELTVV